MGWVIKGLGGSCRGGVDHTGMGWVIKGWGGVGHVGWVGWVMQGWGGVGHAGVGSVM